MAKKDIAALFIIDKWFLATKEMKADCRGWYLNLILHQYDKKDLPNDIEELANLADVRITEYEKFKQVFEHVLKHKFVLNQKGRLENEFAREIIKGREMFKQKRSDAGKLSYVLRYFRDNFKYKKGFEDFVKANIDLNFDTKNEQVLKQVFEQMSELYININVIVDKNINANEEGLVFPFDSENFKNTWDQLVKTKKWKKKEDSALQASLLKLSKYPESEAIEMMLDAIAGEYQGLFPIKKNNSNGTKTNKLESISRGSEAIGKLADSLENTGQD